MKIKRHSSVFDTPLGGRGLGGRGRRRTRLPIIPIVLAALLVLFIAFIWSRGGEHSQVSVEKVIPADRLGQ
ncbi:MAG: hypothetical protein ABI395_09500 [Sphingobium sp.]